MTRRARTRIILMLASGFSIVGLIAAAPDLLPPAAVAGLILFSFGCIVGALRRAHGDRSVSA